MMESVRYTLTSCEKAVEEAIAELGQAGGGHVYVAPLQIETVGLNTTRVTTHIWRVPVGAEPPARSELPDGTVRYSVPAMHRG